MKFSKMLSQKQHQGQKSLAHSKFVKVAFIFIFSRFYALISSPQFYSEINNYYNYYVKASKLIELPYIDFSFSYSLISAIIILLPEILGFNLFSLKIFQIYFASLMMLIDIIIILLLIKFATKRLKFTQDQINNLVLYYSILGAAFFFMIYHNLALMMSLIILMLIVIMTDKYDLTRTKISMIILSVVVKINVILFIPLIALKQSLRRESNREVIISFVTILTSFFTAILILLCIIDILINDKYLSNIFYENNYLNIESIYSSILYILGGYNLVDIEFNYDKGRYYVVTSHFVGFFLTLFCSMVLLKYYIFLSYFIIKSRNVFFKKKNYNKLILEILLVTIMVTIISLKGFSSQYLIWIIPIISLKFSYSNDFAQKLIIITIFILSSYINLFGFFNILTLKNLDIAILALRNLLLLIITINMIISLYKKLNYGN